MNVPPTASSNNEGSALDLSSVDDNERTQPQDTRAENTIKPEITGETNTETHSTPTENGGDHLVPTTGE